MKWHPIWSWSRECKNCSTRSRPDPTQGSVACLKSMQFSYFVLIAMKTPQNLTLFPLIRRIACFRFQQKKLRQNHVGARERQTRAKRGAQGGRQVIKITTSNLPVLLILDGVECEFREPQVRLTFREAVQLFEHRSQFIRRSSDACLVRSFTYYSFFFCFFL